MPDHDGLCALIRRSGPVAATSANLSGAPETHSAAAVAAQLDGRLPLILDAPPAAEQPASTIVDLTASHGAQILRRGGRAAEIAAFLADPQRAPC
jgi:L-threonylcarbamoyladenylate synthase